MKKLAIILLVSFSIFSFGCITMAEGNGVTLSADYSFLDNSDSGQKLNTLGLGIDYDKDDWTLGGNYLTASSYDPAAPGRSDNMFFVYGGFNFVQNDPGVTDIGKFTLAAIVSYWNWNYDPGSTVTTSLGLGIKGTLDFGSGNASLLYSHGMSNVQNNHSGYIDVSVLEAKGVYYFSESVGVNLVYRWIPYKTDSVGGAIYGLGLGVEFKL